jgi:TetR/AcrR family transcriptional repressor of nem operon
MSAIVTAQDTSEQILDVAEKLVQTRGFNGFSYADIAQVVRITKASLHYHFPTKAELGRRLIERYHDRFVAALDAIDRDSGDAREKLRRYVQLYADVLKQNRMCLCGMLAAEYATLPKPMKDGLKRFFDTNEAWLSEIIEKGRKAKTLRVAGQARDVARALVGSLEGSMLMARSYGELAYFQSASGRLLAGLGAGD